MNIFLRFFKSLFSKRKRVTLRREVSGKRKKIFLTSRTKSKANKDYNKLISKFKRKRKRIPTRNEKFMIVVQAILIN